MINELKLKLAERRRQLGDEPEAEEHPAPSPGAAACLAEALLVPKALPPERRLNARRLHVADTFAPPSREPHKVVTKAQGSEAARWESCESDATLWQSCLDAAGELHPSEPSRPATVRRSSSGARNVACPQSHSAAERLTGQAAPSRWASGATTARRGESLSSIRRQLAEALAERDGALAQGRRLHEETRRLGTDNAALRLKLEELRAECETAGQAEGSAKEDTGSALAREPSASRPEAVKSASPRGPEPCNCQCAASLDVQTSPVELDPFATLVQTVQKIRAEEASGGAFLQVEKSAAVLRTPGGLGGPSVGLQRTPCSPGEMLEIAERLRAEGRWWRDVLRE